MRKLICGSYVRRAITYLAEPGSRVPAYLLIPKAVRDGSAGASRSGVLCLMGTNRDIGSKMVVGLGGEKSLPNRDYGKELAEMGYVIVCPTTLSWGAYRPDLKSPGYQSGTMKAIWDKQHPGDRSPCLDPWCEAKRVRGHRPFAWRTQCDLYGSVRGSASKSSCRVAGSTPSSTTRTPPPGDRVGDGRRNSTCPGCWTLRETRYRSTSMSWLCRAALCLFRERPDS